MNIRNSEMHKEIDKLLGMQTKEEITDGLLKLKAGIPPEKTLWRSPYRERGRQIAMLIVLLLSVIKIAFIQTTYFDSNKESVNKICYNMLDIAIYFFWLLAPPLAFLYEYLWLFGKDVQNRLDSDQMNDLKYCHELASKAWAAVLLCFSILLYVRYGFKF